MSKPFEVLIVDDEPDVRELLMEHFRELGYQVASAANGRAALTAIERDPSKYGLIITDLQLPGADGLSVLRAAKEANPSVYVVIITGYASLDSAIQAVRLGAYDYLPKPFSLGQIDVIVHRVNDRLALEEENRRLMRRLAAENGAAAGARVLPLDRIETRLARIEALLQELTSHGKKD